MTRTEGIFAAACLTLLLTLPLLGHSRVFQVSEAREGTVVFEMLSSGNYILPRRNGVLIPSKPPLFHWIGVALARVFETYDEFVLRLPSALAAAATAAILFALAWDLAGPSVAIVQIFLLLSTYGFLRHAADGRVDMLFCSLVCAAVAHWLRSAAQVYHAGLGPERIPGRTYFVMGSYAGLAVLAKGPLGVALPLIVISSIVIVTWGRKALFSLLRPGWMAALVIALPWYLLAAADGGESFFQRQILFENFSRFVGGEAINAKPFWFYFKEFWAHAAPWSVLAPPLLFALYRKDRALMFPPCERLDARSTFALQSGMVWFIALITFFTLSAGKRSAYLLPLLPAFTLVIAILIVGRWTQLSLSEVARRRIRSIARFSWSALIGFGVTSSCALEFGWFNQLQTWPRLMAAVGLYPKAIKGSEWILLLLFIGFAVLGFSAWRMWCRKNQPYLMLAAIFFTLQIPLTVYAAVGMAVRGMTHSFHDFAVEVAHALPEGEKLSIVKRAPDEQLDTFIFYFRRQFRLIEPEAFQPEPGYLLVQNRLLDSLPQETRTKLHPILTGGRVANTSDKQWTLALVKFEATIPR